MILIIALLLVLKIYKENHLIYFTFMAQQKQENDRFAHMIDSTDEAYLNI